MSEHQQPNEYIITERTIDDISEYMIRCEVSESCRDYIIGRLRSSQYPAPDKLATVFNFEDFDNNATEWLKQHDATIARKAREDVLDALMDDLEFLPSSEDSMHVVWIAMRDVQGAIDARKVSLCHPTTPQEHP